MRQEKPRFAREKCKYSRLLIRRRLLIFLKSHVATALTFRKLCTDWPRGPVGRHYTNYCSSSVSTVMHLCHLLTPFENYVAVKSGLLHSQPFTNSQFHFLIVVEAFSAMITLKTLHFAHCMYLYVFTARNELTNYRSQTTKNMYGILVALCTTYRRVTGKIDLQLRIPSPMSCDSIC
jgi:hypothetical protein